MSSAFKASAGSVFLNSPMRCRPEWLDPFLSPTVMWASNVPLKITGGLGLRLLSFTWFFFTCGLLRTEIVYYAGGFRQQVIAERWLCAPVSTYAVLSEASSRRKRGVRS